MEAEKLLARGKKALCQLHQEAQRKDLNGRVTNWHVVTSAV